MKTLKIQGNRNRDQWGKDLSFVVLFILILILFFILIFYTSGLQVHCGLWHCSGACWRELQQGHSLAGVGEGQLAPQVKGWVKHHHAKRQMEAPCRVRPCQVSVHCGSHIFADHNCCTLDILSMLSWNFFRPLLLASQ